MRSFAQITIFLAWGGLIMSACSGSSDESGDGEQDSTLYIPRTELAKRNELKSTTGVTWIVNQVPMLDSSLVNVTVEVQGISSDTVSLDFGEVDPVLAIQLEDLDKDGFQELYIITQSMSAESSGTILGMYSNEDKSLALISFEGATPYHMKEGEAYEGYRGHDHLVFKKGVLTNTFPVYRPEDSDDKPTGGERTLTYTLLKGPSSVLLRPIRTK